MKKELLLAKDFVLNSSTPAETLEMADMYITMYNRNPKNFDLPQQHEAIRGIVFEYADKPLQFVEYVKEVRDEMPKEHYQSTHEVFRKIQSRVVQQERRRRLYEGVDQIETVVNQKFTFGQRQAVMAWLEAYWGKERLAKLDDARRARGVNRLTTEERGEICDEFWAEIDNQLEHNIVPVPPEIVYAKLASLESHKPNRVRDVP